MRLCLLLFSLLWLSGCSFIRRLMGIPEVPIVSTGVSDKPLQALTKIVTMPTVDAGWLNWAMWSTWAGALCVLAGVVWLLWIPNKHNAIRLIGTGFALQFVARLMIWFSNNHVWLWVAVGIFGIIYLATHPVLVEKILAKLGIFVDVNGDGMYGTKKIVKNNNPK